MLRIAVCIEDRKYDSVPASDLRLIALDMRGHGLSDKPGDGYADSGL